QVFPQSLCIVDQITTLHDLQKLLGTINWVHPLLGITTEELSPLFSMLKGDSDLLSP
ncbi:POK6 protein, partial [Chunga burmeisteri]|nr:POK6 protein [Chunga burmeisteri]